MALLKAIVERWERERREKIEDERLFDISEQSGRLVLIRRQRPVFNRAIPAALFATFWCVGSWYIYQSPADRGAWLILFLIFGLFITIPTCINAWRAWKGDVWVIDSNHGRVERNGVLTGDLSRMESVRVWMETYDENSVSRLAIISVKGKKIVLGDYGDTRKNWQELTSVAQLIAQYTHLPVEIQPY